MAIKTQILDFNDLTNPQSGFTYIGVSDSGNTIAVKFDDGTIKYFVDQQELYDYTSGITSSLGGLTDVNISGKTDGQSLTYDIVSDKWIPKTVGIDTSNFYNKSQVDGLISTEETLRISGDTYLESLIDDLSSYQLTQPDGTNPFVYTDNGGNLHIDGNIIQSGHTYETHAEQLYTRKDLITLRDGAIQGLTPTEMTGMVAKKYDGTNDGQLVFDYNGVARVGDVGDLKPLAVREETPLNNGIAKWNQTEQRFDTVDESFFIVSGKTGTNKSSTITQTSGSILLDVNNSTYNTFINMTPTNGVLVLGYSNDSMGTGTTQLQIGGSQIGSNKPIKYWQDYSSSYDDRTLVDKEYVSNNFSVSGHSHTISNITDLQTTLNSKSDTGHTHSQYLTGVTFTNVIVLQSGGTNKLYDALTSITGNGTLIVMYPGTYTESSTFNGLNNVNYSIYMYSGAIIRYTTNIIKIRGTGTLDITGNGTLQYVSGGDYFIKSYDSTSSGIINITVDKCTHLLANTYGGTTGTRINLKTQEVISGAATNYMFFCAKSISLNIWINEYNANDGGSLFNSWEAITKQIVIFINRANENITLSIEGSRPIQVENFDYTVNGVLAGKTVTLKGNGILVTGTYFRMYGNYINSINNVYLEGTFSQITYDISNLVCNVYFINKLYYTSTSNITFASNNILHLKDVNIITTANLTSGLIYMSAGGGKVYIDNVQFNFFRTTDYLFRIEGSSDTTMYVYNPSFTDQGETFTLSGTTTSPTAKLITTYVNPILPTIFQDVQDPTGFLDNSNIVVSYNLTGRTITLSNASGINYYFKGTKYSLGTSWTSSVHPTGTTNQYLYSTDGTNFIWATSSWAFNNLQVASVTSNGFCLREVHGTMGWDTHQEFHNTIGTYRSSGGGLQTGTYTVQPATPSDGANKPNFESIIINDEDLATTLPLWSGSSYTQLYFSSGSTVNFLTGQTNIFLTGTTYPRYNSYNGTTFSLTEMGSGNYANYYVMHIPVSSDSESQKYRSVVIQPQFIYTSLVNAQAENPQSLNFGGLTSLLNEFVIYERITIRTQSAYNTSTGRCRIEAVANIVGTRFSQTSTGVGTTTAGNVSVVPISPFTSTNLQGLSDEYANKFATLTPTTPLTGSSYIEHYIYTNTYSPLYNGLVLLENGLYLQTWYYINLYANFLNGPIFTDNSSLINWCDVMCNGMDIYFITSTDMGKPQPSFYTSNVIKVNILTYTSTTFLSDMKNVHFNHKTKSICYYDYNNSLVKIFNLKTNTELVSMSSTGHIFDLGDGYFGNVPNYAYLKVYANSDTNQEIYTNTNLYESTISNYGYRFDGYTNTLYYTNGYMKSFSIYNNAQERTINNFNVYEFYVIENYVIIRNLNTTYVHVLAKSGAELGTINIDNRTYGGFGNNFSWATQDGLVKCLR